MLQTRRGRGVGVNQGCASGHDSCSLSVLLVLFLSSPSEDAQNHSMELHLQNIFLESLAHFHILFHFLEDVWIWVYTEHILWMKCNDVLV